MPLADFRRLVDLCYRARVPKVHICATGEPFLHHDILAMIDYVAARYGRASVQTKLVTCKLMQLEPLLTIRLRPERCNFFSAKKSLGSPWSL